MSEKNELYEHDMQLWRKEMKLWKERNKMKLIKLNLVDVDYPIYINPDYVIVIVPHDKDMEYQTLITVATQINGTNISYAVHSNIETIMRLLMSSHPLGA